MVKGYIQRGIISFFLLIGAYYFSQMVGLNAHLEEKLGIELPALWIHQDVPRHLPGLEVTPPDLDVPDFEVKLPPSSSDEEGQEEAAAAAKKLQSIRVANSMALGYKREHFGDGWATTRGCDTRNKVLARDLGEVKYKPGSTCVVTSGVLQDPYMGATVQFLRGPSTSQAVQVDHVVSTSAAWRLGASEWSKKRRIEFYNDMDNLLAVDGPTNQAKSDRTLEEFATAKDKKTNKPLLAPESTCAFAIKYVEVTAKYDLKMTADDIAYASSTLTKCAARE
ncbi:HNH endonuclease family protein [Jonesiaceae bacterium BS-20]|uniref:HNH endonuclease family protein n=1 Tax=Jonesiaceae bacterium BS-20 TaxID=3120821 RepID=A0AAU7DZ18_9MICO